MNKTELLKEGKNCWRKAPSKRAAFLIDAAAYFEAFTATVRRAQKAIYIVGWDIDSRIRLLRNSRDPSPLILLEFLNQVVARRKGLHAYVLVWDFSMIYAFEREPFPLFSVGWRKHHRLHFHMDGNHPFGASHHQKMVVVDDAVAFAGGLDLTKCRWDTPEHYKDDARRYDPWCGYYSPFHDVQMIVDGDAAHSLGDLIRERWLRATGRRLTPPRVKGHDPWPPGLTPDIENVLIGIARTEPLYKHYPEVREVESLYRDAILAARRFIYIESQYFTSSSVADVLGARLQEVNGPEIVLVLPYRSSGWLEEKTMDVLRARLLLRLKALDRFNRLRVYYPTVSHNGDGRLNVHSKVLVVDDWLVRIGSANLSNRSMGLDTECDLVVEANGDSRKKTAIVGLRNRLLGEHLGTLPEKVEEMVNKKNSLNAAIEALRGPGRTLQSLLQDIPESPESWIYESGLLDPERPPAPAELIGQFVPDEIKESGRGRILTVVLMLLAMLGLAYAWEWGPLKEWLNLGTVSYWASYIANSSLALLWIVLGFTLGGLVMFPVTVLIVAVAMTFEPVTAFFYSLVGCLSSAITVYYVGHVLGRETIRKIAGSRLNRLSMRLGRQGFMVITVLRLFPIGPYTVINLVAGASHIRFKDYILGTILGLLPGLVAITALGDRLGGIIRSPKPENFVQFASLLVIIAVANIVAHRWMSKRESNKDHESSMEKVPNE